MINYNNIFNTIDEKQLKYDEENKNNLNLFKSEINHNEKFKNLILESKKDITNEQNFNSILNLYYKKNQVQLNKLINNLSKSIQSVSTLQRKLVLNQIDNVHNLFSFSLIRNDYPDLFISFNIIIKNLKELSAGIINGFNYNSILEQIHISAFNNIGNISLDISVNPRTKSYSLQHNLGSKDSIFEYFISNDLMKLLEPNLRVKYYLILLLKTIHPKLNKLETSYIHNMYFNLYSSLYLIKLNNPDHRNISLLFLINYIFFNIFYYRLDFKNEGYVSLLSGLNLYESDIQVKEILSRVNLLGISNNKNSLIKSELDEVARVTKSNNKSDNLAKLINNTNEEAESFVNKLNKMTKEDLNEYIKNLTSIYDKIFLQLLS